MKTPFDLSVYFVADPSLCGGRDVADVVAAAVSGGATIVQLRNKVGTIDEITTQARKIMNVLRLGATPLLINDYPDIAVDVGADGVHLGQGDCTAEQAREVLGGDAIIGLTAFTEDHFAALDPAVVDYVGTGPVFPTLTDKGKPVMGINGLADFGRLSPVPIVGIGGITPERADEVFATGVQGVAMMRAISEADDPEEAARAFSEIAKNHKRKSAA